jgi:CelD/BcsL family acetyltransferase involved in cellulose biosynthesis
VSLRTEIVSNASRFGDVGPSWRDLWTRCGGFIFQSHDWIGGWLSGVAERRDIKLQIALAWEGDELRGVMPCAVHRRSGLRVLIWAAQLFSDYCDCLVDPNSAQDGVVPLLWDCLRQYGGFDLISLQQLRPDAICRPFLDQLASEGSRLQYGERRERCMRIENRWKDGEAFFRSLNKKGRNNHTRGKRILAEIGGDVSFQVAEPGKDAAPLLDEVLRLKQIWLRINDPSSPLLGPDAGVLRGVLDRALRSGMAQIFLLKCGGKIAAASVNFVYGGRMEAYFTAYDAAFDRASPGTILIVEYARWSFDHGLRHVDFLRGEEAFKFRMANAETVISSFAGSRTLMGQLAVSGHRWLSRWRQRQDVVSTRPDDELEAVS